MSVPVSTTAQHTGIGWGATGGMGYNFNQHHAIIGEFLWNQLYAKSYAMASINAAAPSGGVNGQSDIYSVTGDYRYELRRNKFGTYFIGGGC